MALPRNDAPSATAGAARGTGMPMLPAGKLQLESVSTRNSASICECFDGLSPRSHHLDPTPRSLFLNGDDEKNENRGQTGQAI
jgi:hypothetical protein